MRFRKAVGVLAGAALLIGGLAAAAPATADTTGFDSWVESDDNAPFATTDGLVFYQNAAINFGHKNGAELEDVAPLASVSGLAYTVENSTSFAPSYQVGVVSKRKGITYARLVWEPYLQTSSPGDDKGTYTELENGLWWGANVWTTGGKTTPFGNGDGSQSKPKPLDFFRDYFGYDAQIAFFGVKQGSTSDIVSTVTSIAFQGQKVSLGKADATPYNAKDVSDKVTEATTPLQSQLDAARAALTQSETAALAKLVAAQNDARTAQAKLVTISGTAKVGKSVTAKLASSIPGATSAYQWSVNGKAVKGATKASLKLTKSQAGKPLSVTVTTTWKDDFGTSRSAKVSVKYLTSGKIAK